MSDLREVVAQVLHQFDRCGWHDFGKCHQPEMYRQWADKVLGVVHEHADIEAAAIAIDKLVGMANIEPYVGPPPVVRMREAKAAVDAALGGLEKP